MSVFEGKVRGRTIYARIKGNPALEKWLKANCIASTGPYPDITGMREKYRGRACLIVRAGSYIYNMGLDRGQSIPY